MKTFLPRFIFLPICLLLLNLSSAFGEEMQFAELRAGETVYRNVRVRDVSAKWITILHSGGIAQVPLAQLSPELQARFGYDSERAKEFEQELEKARNESVRKRPSPVRQPNTAVASAPVHRAEVDLRDRFFTLGLSAKNQGRRPSCSVFAILSVVEFHFSLHEQEAQFLSEEFLIWATRQVNPHRTDFDGFTFAEVIAAIHSYGIARSHEMPNTLGGNVADIVATEQVRAAAIERRDVWFQAARGSNEAKIEAMVRELNKGFPVAISLRWPPRGVMARVHTLRDQKPRPEGGHAVTIIGYHQPDPASGELLFLFRNSYGLQWGMGGCGYVSDRYLKEHLYDVISVRRIP